MATIMDTSVQGRLYWLSHKGRTGFSTKLKLSDESKIWLASQAKHVSCWFYTRWVTQGYFDCQTFSAWSKISWIHHFHCNFIRKAALAVYITCHMLLDLGTSLIAAIEWPRPPSSDHIHIPVTLQTCGYSHFSERLIKVACSTHHVQSCRPWFLASFLGLPASSFCSSALNTWTQPLSCWVTWWLSWLAWHTASGWKLEAGNETRPSIVLVYMCFFSTLESHLTDTPEDIADTLWSWMHLHNLCLCKIETWKLPYSVKRTGSLLLTVPKLY